MTKAPLVYLDTQDFIRFRNNGEDKEVAEQLRRLKALRASGSVRLGYSALHIWEFITPTSDRRFVEDRTERGQLIVDVCGVNAFPFYSDLANGARYPNNGFWMPNGIKETALELDKYLREAIDKHCLENGFQANRETRRRLRSPSFLRQFLQEGHRPNWSELSSSDSHNPAIGLVLAKHYERFILGKISSRQLQKKTLEWASDPRSFGALWHEFGNGVNALDEFVGRHLMKLGEVMDDMLAALDDYHSILDGVRSQRKKLVQDMVDSGFDKRFAKSMLPKLPIGSKSFDLKERTEGLNVFGEGRLDHFFHYIGKRLSRIGSFSRSDIGDLMHMIYAMDCDFFRCDREMFNLFSDFPPLCEKLVVSLEDLLDKLERA